mmetsp:Transcript_15723/g.61412  ORF Transcript_15723/g.61412 Transcript_15723/m.61412 type:complete len:278 (-) Transcript_15723:190-1023(-)
MRSSRCLSSTTRGLLLEDPRERMFASEEYLTLLLTREGLKKALLSAFVAIGAPTLKAYSVAIEPAISPKMLRMRFLPSGPEKKLVAMSHLRRSRSSAPCCLTPSTCRSCARRSSRMASCSFSDCWRLKSAYFTSSAAFASISCVIRRFWRSSSCSACSRSRSSLSCSCSRSRCFCSSSSRSNSRFASSLTRILRSCCSSSSSCLYWRRFFSSSVRFSSSFFCSSALIRTMFSAFFCAISILFVFSTSKASLVLASSSLRLVSSSSCIFLASSCIICV